MSIATQRRRQILSNKLKSKSAQMRAYAPSPPPSFLAKLAPTQRKAIQQQWGMIQQAQQIRQQLQPKPKGFIDLLGGGLAAARKFLLPTTRKEAERHPIRVALTKKGLLKSLERTGRQFGIVPKGKKFAKEEREAFPMEMGFTFGLMGPTKAIGKFLDTKSLIRAARKAAEGLSKRTPMAGRVYTPQLFDPEKIPIVGGETVSRTAIKAAKNVFRKGRVKPVIISPDTGLLSNPADVLAARELGVRRLPGVVQFQRQVATGEMTGSARVFQQIADSLPKIRDRIALRQIGITKKKAGQAATIEKLRTKVTGAKGFMMEKKVLKGKFGKDEFADLKDIIKQSDIDEAFTRLVNSPEYTTVWEGHAAGNAFKKLLDGELINASEEILLGRGAGAEFINIIRNNRDIFAKMAEAGTQIINTPKALMASIDISAGFRQGIFFAARHPLRFMQAFLKQFKYWKSDAGIAELNREIAAKKFADTMGGRLALTGLGKNLWVREEAFMAPWVEKVPIIGRGVRASARAFTGMLNKMRADIYDDLCIKAEKLGLNPRENPKLMDDIANLVNLGTGRGSLGALEGAAVGLNNAFFSPRLMSSRLTLLNPGYYLNPRLHPFVRREALESLLSLTAAAGTILTLAGLAGAKVSRDRRSADFLKIRIGNTRIDILGGFQQYLRLYGQIAAGQIKSTTTGEIMTLGEGYRALNRGEVAFRGFEGKLSPAASFAWFGFKGETMLGEDFNVPTEVMERFVPMAMKDMYDLVRDKGPAAAPLGLLAFIGVGLQTYEQRPMTVASRKRRIAAVYTQVRKGEITQEEAMETIRNLMATPLKVK
jgi:hypothetical protein